MQSGVRLLPSLGVVHYQWYGPGGLDDPVELTATLSNASEITNSTTFVVVENDQVGLARPNGTGYWRQRRSLPVCDYCE